MEKCGARTQKLTPCTRWALPGKEYCKKHLEMIQAAAAEEEDESFDNLPITQIVCNLTRSFKEARELPCTEIGHKIAANFVRVSATRIFADPYQSIMELVSNAIDAVTRNKNAIGRFGMGFFSIFALMLKTNDFQSLILSTTHRANKGKLKSHILKVVVDENGALVAKLKKRSEPRLFTCTGIALLTKRPLKPTTIATMKEMVERFKFSEAVSITLDNQQVNSAHDDAPIVDIRISPFDFIIEDRGPGMSPAQLAQLLTPSLSSKGLKVLARAAEPPVRCQLVKADRCGLVLCVNGVQIKRIELPLGTAPVLSVILLPPSTKLPVARNDVILSDLESYRSTVQGFEDLIKMHIRAKNVAKLRALVAAYAKESKQPEAHKLVAHIDARILSSGVLLVPDNADIKYVCAALKLSFVVSDLFSISKLERRIVEAANKNRMVVDEAVFEYSILVQVEFLKYPIQKLPFLPSLVFVKEGTSDQEIAAFCENPLNGCKTHAQYTAQASAQLTATLTLAQLENKEYQDRARIVLADPRQGLFKNISSLWHARFKEIVADDFGNFLTHLIMLMMEVEMDLDSCKEQLSIIAGKLTGATIVLGYNTTYGRKPVQLAAFTHDKYDALLEKKPRRNVDFVLNMEPIPEMVMELLKHDVSIFPTEVHPGSALPSPGKNWILKNVRALQVHHVDLRDVCALLADVHKHSVHIVESFFILQLFVYYFSSHDFRSVRTSLRVVRWIRNELRRHVALDTMIQLYTNVKCHGGKHIEIAHANISSPIASLFPIIGEAVVGSELAAWLTDETEIFNGWAKLGNPDAEYKFSINDIMMFVYTDTRLRVAADFMQRDILLNLTEFALRKDRSCPIQAVTIAANFANTKSAVASSMSELVQNSSDAINGSDLPEEKRRIDIGVNTKQLNFKDRVGIKDAAIMSLLVPFFSEKSGQVNVSGEMGTGAFNLFRKPLCDHVIFATKFHNHYVKIVATPVVEHDLVTDVDLHLAIFENSPLERGTEICLFFDTDKVDGVEVACQVQIECMSNFFATPFPVFVNKVCITEEKMDEVYVAEEIVTVRGVLGNSVKPSILTIGGVPFGLLAENWHALMGPGAQTRQDNSLTFQSEDMQLATQTNLVVDIDRSQISPVQSRTELLFKNAETLRFHIKRAQVLWLLALYARDKVNSSFVPNTDASCALRPLKFYNGPVQVKWHDASWLPRDFEDFAVALHWVISETLGRMSRDEYATGTGIINRMQINQTVKDAMLRWFAAKKPQRVDGDQELSCVAKGADSVVSEQRKFILETNAHSRVSAIELFILALLTSFNDAVKSNVLTLSTCETFSPRFAGSNTQMPKIAVVNDGQPLAANGLWSSQHKVLLYDSSHRRMAEKFVAAVKRLDKENLKDKFPDLVKEHFFTKHKSVVIHEFIHCVFDEEHSDIDHPSLRMTWKKQTFQNTFDGMAETLYNNLCEFELNSKFLELLQLSGVV